MLADMYDMLLLYLGLALFILLVAVICRNTLVEAAIVFGIIAFFFHSVLWNGQNSARVAAEEFMRLHEIRVALAPHGEKLRELHENQGEHPYAPMTLESLITQLDMGEEVPAEMWQGHFGNPYMVQFEEVSGDLHLALWWFGFNQVDDGGNWDSNEHGTIAADDRKTQIRLHWEEEDAP